MKYKIEKNSVQETLVIPLYGRKMCTELYPNMFRDDTAVRLRQPMHSARLWTHRGFQRCA